MIKKFNREYLIEELGLPSEAIYKEPVEQHRWETLYKIIFQDKDGTYWKTYVLRGSTEMQPTIPWEFEEEVECQQVEKRIIQVEDWAPVDEGEEYD